MKTTRVVIKIEQLNKIIKKVPRFDGGKMTLSDAARYAIQKVVDELEKK